ncbi:SusC/RagA family TonB-linked outer membrane protein [Sphingobacterium hungaricum]|uniref:SusC/RagA family TonB-linked outer membrane protein n=1 Tax=Sphingobacterium hungaricum TaxID=2082723 RepID=A0A928YQ14_9SPHI|nr:SusC/RagA family TonB-linked outer membrane protein [Sphingobacterium hungaricum]MBE8713127.1 SusC/RagA family TonB-linked outer membrane protein [Sphingobacterium hungaricum]
MKQKLLSIFLLCTLLVGVSYAQNRQVSGKVTSSIDGSPISGVSVLIQGTNTGTQTDGNGNFSISVSNGDKLIIRYIGYESQTITVGNQSTISVQLASTENTLDEVVVTGAGLTATRKSIGNAQTTIKGDDLLQGKPQNVVTGLSGKVAGLTIQGVSSGVNPNYRVILRGMRSLTGNNQALIVIDNVISPSSILGNLNPDDIEDITVLNGSGAAALYGSAASNGALIIKTKKGKATDGFEINVENTSTWEQIVFLPQVQQRFGSGADNDLQIYNPHENQQYGPVFDGSMVEIGDPLADGSIQTVPYSWTGSKNDFWEVGYSNQTNISIASRTEKSSFRTAAQYLDASGTVPFDKYKRATARISGTQNLIENKLDATYTAYYAQNRYNTTSANASIYDLVLNTPGQIPLTDYKDYVNNPYATPDGYYNAYYNNPYFLAGNNRSITRNDYFMGNFELAYKPLEWLDFLGRVGITSANQSFKNTTGVYYYSDFTKSWAGSSTYKQQDILGSVSDGFNYTTNIVSDFNAHATHTNQDFKFDYTLIGQYIQNQYSGMSAAVSGLAVPDIFNLGNSLNNPTANQASYLARTFGLAGKVDIAYKNYLFLSLSGRNDWVSILDPDNRSFFYPAASLSFIPTDAFASLKEFRALDFLKIRAGLSKVGQVNLGSSTNFGAYSLLPTFSQGAGYPYNGIGGHTISNQIVQPGLKPEMTTSFEVGLESAWLKNRIIWDFTYYNNETVDNVVPTGVSTSTGYSSYLVNAGTTTGKGIETKLILVPYRTTNWEVSVGANYAYFDNKVTQIAEGLDVLQLGAYASGAGSYAMPGEAFPVIRGTKYNRDDQGRIIVNPLTGYPSTDGTLHILGNAMPNHTLGLNLNVSWKDLSFHTQAEYRTGNVIYNAGGSTFDFSGAGINTAAYNRDRFIIPNSSYWDEASQSYVENTNISVRDGGPGYWSIAGPRTGIHETYITSAAFWKIREMSLTYRVPKSFLATQNVIKEARISLQGRNLFLWTPSTNVYTDPEYSDGNGNSNGNAVGLTNLSQTPPSRYFGFSIGLTL